MDSDDLTKQIEEIEALCSIYGDEWKIDSEITRSYSTVVTDGDLKVHLSVTLPNDYPSKSPPNYELSAPWMQRKEKANLHAQLNQIYLDNAGEPVMFQWVERIRETLQDINERARQQKSEKEKAIAESTVAQEKTYVKCPDISHGEVITDRKSSFQGHAAKVTSVEEVHAVLHELKQHKKIANAYHNMYAYRIERTDGRKGVVQDCDDDGEAHAGGRMLHLLQILDQKATVVVVSRWYGGIQLGPDRFRHINNAARSAIVQAGLLKS